MGCKKFNIGDHVRVRSMSDMAAEYGKNGDESIPVNGVGLIFNPLMKYMCEKSGIINDKQRTAYYGMRYFITFDDDYIDQEDWVLTAEMLEPYSPPSKNREFDIFFDSLINNV